MDSILVSIKKMLGIEPEYTHFDPEIIVFINMALGICFQLGVGPKDKPFVISDDLSKWTDFIGEDQIETVKTYIFAKVKLLFDPPTNSYTIAMLQDLIKEFEWRCNVHAETP